MGTTGSSTSNLHADLPSTPHLSMTTTRVENTADLGRRLQAHDVPLGSFTDAELGAVTGPDAPEGRLVPLPHLDSLPAADRIAAMVEGHRSLRGRGLLDQSAAPTGELATLIPIRARPRAIAIADRRAHGVASQRYLYGAVLSADTGAIEATLEEDVDTDGTHTFTLRSGASAAQHLTEFVDPDGRAQEDDGPARLGATMAVPGSWREVDAAMASAEVVTRLFSTRPRTAPGEPRSRRASLVASPTGLLVVAGYAPRSQQPTTDAAVLYAQALSRETLEELLATFVRS